VTTPTIEGTAEAGATVVVEILNGTDSIFTTTVEADSNGEWTAPISDVNGNPVLPGDGTYSVHVTATDLAGNEATDSSYSFELDTTVNEVGFHMVEDLANDTGFTDDDQYTSNRNPEFQWTSDEDLTATFSIYDENGHLLEGKTYTEDFTAGENSWAVPSGAPLNDGDYTVTVTFTDAAGNVLSKDINGDPISVNLTVDTVPPELTVGLTHDSDSGTKGDWLTSDEAVGDGDSSNADTATTYDVDKDSDPVSVTGQELTNAGLSISGTTETGARVSVYVNDVLVSNDDTVIDGDERYLDVTNGDGSWTFDLSALTVGDGLNDYAGGISTNVIKIVSEDQAGNESTIIQTLTVDSNVSAGSIALDTSDSSDTGTIGDFLTSDTTPTLTGSTESGAVVQLYLVDSNGDETLVGTDVADGGGLWSVSVDESTFYNDENVVEEGSYTFKIVVTDEAGNQDSTTQNITISSAPDEPEVSISEDSAGEFFGTDNDFITNDVTPTFTVDVEANTSLVVTRNGETVSGGAWNTETEYEFTENLGDGTYEYVFTSTDSNGLTNTHTQTVVIDSSYADGDLTLGVLDISNSGDDDYDEMNPDGTPDVITTNFTAPILTGTAEPGSKTLMYVSEMFATEADALAAVNGYDLEDATEVSLDVNGKWAPVPVLSNGDGYYVITIISEDLAGNRQDESTIINLDTSAPAPPSFILTTDEGEEVTGDALDSITDLTPRFEGTADTSDEVTTVVTVYGSTGSVAVSFVADVAADGSWSYQVGGHGAEWLTGDDYTVEVVSTDRAGNVSTYDTYEFTVLQDTGASPTVGLLSSDDTGDDSDGITSLSNVLQPDGELTLTGSSVAFSDVEIYLQEGGSRVLVSTVTAGENGTWSYTLEDTPADGEYDYVVVTVSNGQESDPFTLEVDSSVEDATVNLFSDTGSDASDWITSNPTLTGVVEKGSTVKIIATDVHDASNTEAITVNPDDFAKVNGEWVYTASGLSSELADGEYSITVMDTDVAGNTSTVVLGNTLVLDTELDTPTTIRLVANDDSELSVTEGIIDGSGGIAKYTDLGGDYSSSASDDVTYVSDLGITGTAEAGAEVRLSMTCNDKDYLSGVTITAADDGTWSYNPDDLGDGNYTASIVVVDAAGNTSPTVELKFEVDAVATTTARIDLADDNDTYTADATPTLTLWGDSDSTYLLYCKEQGEDDSAYVLVDRGSFNSDSESSYTAENALAEGHYVYTLVTVDEAGNVQKSSEYTIHVDLTAPEAPDDAADISVNTSDGTSTLTSLVDGYLYTDDNETVVTVNVADDVLYVVLTNGGDYSEEVRVVNGVATFPLFGSETAMKDGSYDYHFEFYDNVRNHDENNDLPFTLVVDTNAPDTTIDFSSTSDRGASDTDLLTSGDTLLFEGKITETDEDVSTSEIDTIAVAITVDGVEHTYTASGIEFDALGDWSHVFAADVNAGTAAGTLTYDSGGNWTFTYGEDGTELDSGTYTAEITVTDMSGNESSASLDNDKSIDVDNNDINAPDLTVLDLTHLGIGTYFSAQNGSDDYRLELSFHGRDGADLPETTTLDYSNNGTASTTLDIEDATYVEAKIIDVGGAESETTFIDLDSTDLDFSSEVETSATTVSSITMKLVGDIDGDGVQDTVTDTVAVNIADGSWEWDFNLDASDKLAEGNYTLSFEALSGQDGEGNSVSTTINADTSATWSYDFTVLADEMAMESDNQNFSSGEADSGGSGGGEGGVAETVEIDATVHTDYVEGNVA